LIASIEDRIAGYEKDFKTYKSFQREKLDLYSERDFLSYTNQPIIVEVRDQKKNIDDLDKRLNDVEEMLSQLNNKLILQDMENATKLLEKKA